MPLKCTVIDATPPGGTWTVPTGVTSIVAELIGGGGGGGSGGTGRYENIVAAAGQAGRSGIAGSTVTVILNTANVAQLTSIVIGTGGTGGAGVASRTSDAVGSSGAAGTNGTNTSLTCGSTTYTAAGGGGGTAGAAGSTFTTSSQAQSFTQGTYPGMHEAPGCFVQSASAYANTSANTLGGVGGWGGLAPALFYAGYASRTDAGEMWSPVTLDKVTKDETIPSKGQTGMLSSIGGKGGDGSAGVPYNGTQDSSPGGDATGYGCSGGGSGGGNKTNGTGTCWGTGKGGDGMGGAIFLWYVEAV